MNTQTEIRFDRYRLTDEEEVFSTISNKYIHPNKPSVNGYRMVCVRANDGSKHVMTYAKFKMILADYREDWKDFDCDHIDSDNLNDSMDNLQWMSHADNVNKRDKSSLKGREPHSYVVEHLEDGGETEVFLRLQDAKAKGYNANTLHTLATSKEGKNYSLKSKIVVRRYSDEQIIEYIKNKR